MIILIVIITSVLGLSDWGSKIFEKILNRSSEVIAMRPTAEREAVSDRFKIARKAKIHGLRNPKLRLIASSGTLHSENKQFINKEDHFVVMEQSDHKVICHDPILEKQMKETGIAIPPADQVRYGGRERVMWGEENFFEAFQEFYSVYIFDPELYEWK